MFTLIWILVPDVNVYLDPGPGTQRRPRHRLDIEPEPVLIGIRPEGGYIHMVSNMKKGRVQVQPPLSPACGKSIDKKFIRENK